MRIVGHKFNSLGLFISMAIYKIAIDLGYKIILVERYSIYTEEFNFWKYMVGCLFCVMIFLTIKHERKKASTFFLYLIFLLQIIPITTIFAFKNEAWGYYCILLMCFWLCIFLVNYTAPIRKISSSFYFSKIMVGISIALVIFVLGAIILKNGAPSLIALDLFDVYELRGSGSFKLGGYLQSFLLPIVIGVILPVAVAKTINDKKYMLSVAACVLIFLIYLYTGHKTYLFYILLSVGVSIWARRENCYKEMFIVFCLAVSILTLFVVVDGDNPLWYNIYTFLIRRALIVPAELKFVHFDYFSSHPFLGLYGALPRLLVFSIPKYYTEVTYPFDIGKIYYNAPYMSADTGVFAEGYARFGYIGICIVLLLCLLLLKLADNLQSRTSYTVAISFLVCPFYSLAETQVIGRLFFGTWMFFIIIMMFYKEETITYIKN